MEEWSRWRSGQGGSIMKNSPGASVWYGEHKLARVPQPPRRAERFKLPAWRCDDRCEHRLSPGAGGERCGAEGFAYCGHQNRLWPRLSGVWGYMLRSAQPESSPPRPWGDPGEGLRCLLDRGWIGSGASPEMQTPQGARTTLRPPLWEGVGISASISMGHPRSHCCSHHCCSHHLSNGRKRRLCSSTTSFV